MGSVSPTVGQLQISNSNISNSCFLAAITITITMFLPRLTLFKPNGSIRAFASASSKPKPKNKKLPLAGLKVLDLSRVLAGVRTHSY